MDAALHPMHIDAIKSDRLKFPDLWRAIQNGVLNSELVKRDSNSIGVEYHPSDQTVSIYLTYSDGSDERRLPLETAEALLRQYCVGGDA